MNTIILTVLKVTLTKLFTEKVLIAIFIHVAEYLTKKTSNTLDDELVAEVKKALNKSQGLGPDQK
ncbi:hypothetical protein [Marinomonas transparens]|uniref:Uncharacterized protein n=1 Tax=Marinomonas transparens TaxID=2795388 RepID=A0A934JVE4_9GAMM|nr:hypothetical protein [Marinomonas transparens]MBJ7539076.1 hypothetical protein [Marinomonas transparens]